MKNKYTRVINRPSAKANVRHVSNGNVYTSSLFAELWCHVMTNYTNFEMHTGK